MPMKYSTTTWNAVRERMTVLTEDEDMRPNEAAMRVEREAQRGYLVIPDERGGERTVEVDGAPAYGTIMNRFRNHWKSPSAVGALGYTGNGEANDLRDQLKLALEELGQVRGELTKLRESETEELKSLRAQLVEEQKAAARAQGEAGVLKEIVLEEAGPPLNGNGHPAI